LALPQEYGGLEVAVVDIVKSYRLERHIKRDEDRKRLQINKQVYLDPEFRALWERIKHKTTYSVDYPTEVLLEKAVAALKRMPPVEPLKIVFTQAQVNVNHSGVTTRVTSAGEAAATQTSRMPDMIEYLQNRTDLTRGTLARVLVKSGRLGDALVNPQAFMDLAANAIQRVMHELVLEGIKYERVEGGFFDMRLFETEEIVSYLTERFETNKSVYDAVVYDSEVEREFAEKMEAREDIKLFVKLPPWFKVDTPLGTYNPDWAIVKHGDSALYLVRETKGTLNFEHLRQVEEQKIKCGTQHFQTLGVDYKIIVSADEI